MLLIIFWFFNCNFIYYTLLIFYFEQMLAFLNYFNLESLLTVCAQILVSLSLNFKFLYVIILFLVNYYFNTLNLILVAFIYFELNNMLNFTSILAYTKITPSLHNGYLIIHPVLLYSSIALFALILIISCAVTVLHINLHLKREFIAFSFLITALAVMLGCSWAGQELNWGGWWSWDVIELGSLIILIFLLKATHFNKKNSFYLYNSGIHTLFLFLFFWFGARFGFFNSVHSFIDQQGTTALTKRIYFLFLSGFFLFINSHTKNNILNKFTVSIDIFCKFIFFSIVTDSFLNIFSNFIFFINTLLKLALLFAFKVKFIFLNLAYLDLFLLLFFINKKLTKSLYLLHNIMVALIICYLYTDVHINVKNFLNTFVAYDYFYLINHFFIKEQQCLKLLLSNSDAFYTYQATHFYIFTKVTHEFFNKAAFHVFELEPLQVFFYVFCKLSFLTRIYFDFIIITCAATSMIVCLFKLVKLAFK